MRGTDTVNANIYLRDAQFFLRPVNTLSLMLSAKQSRIQPPCQEKATSMGSFRQGERLTRGEMATGSGRCQLLHPSLANVHFVTLTLGGCRIIHSRP